jgi:hypothetical protein
MSYDLTNELLSKGTPCHWTPSMSLTYFILASRYQNESKRAYPGLEGFTRVTNLKTSAQLKNISQLKKEGWIIQTKRGQTGQRAEYKVLFIESDLHRCRCSTPCGKQGSNLLLESVDSATQEDSPQSATASTELHPKRRTNLTNKTSPKIDQVRFDFVVSRIPVDKRDLISSGTNYEFLLDELVDTGVPVSQIRDFLGSQNWMTSTAPGGLLLTTLRKYLVEMSKPSQRSSYTATPQSSLPKDDQLINALAGFSRGMRLPE